MTKGRSAVLYTRTRPRLSTRWSYRGVITRKTFPRIPAGVYHCGKYPSKKFGLRYHVRDVPERTYILIHAGNFVRDTHGCILLGMNRQYEHGDLKSPCVWSSRVAIENL